MFVLASAEGVALITGIATIVGAAILAGVAAVTTNKRLTKQITAERERQERDLRAAGERQREELDERTDGQRRQLAHARELADLADLRKLLDEAAVALDEARDARDELDVSFTEHGRHLPDEPKLKLADRGRRLFPLLVRLQIRLGPQHAITTQFSRAAEALLNTWRQVTHFEDDDAAILVEKRKVIRDDLDAFTTASLAFTKAAVERAGTAETA